MTEGQKSVLLCKTEVRLVTLFHDEYDHPALAAMFEEGWEIKTVIDRPSWQNYSRLLLSREL